LIAEKEREAIKKHKTWFKTYLNYNLTI
jgi:hypothetical protein